MARDENLDLLTPADWQVRYANLCRCAETAPEGLFGEALNIRTYVTDASTAIMTGLLQGHLGSSVGAPWSELQAAIYAYIRRSNPDRVVFSTAEFWGATIDTPEGPAMRERVLAGVAAFDVKNMKVEVVEDNDGAA